MTFVKFEVSKESNIYFACYQSAKWHILSLLAIIVLEVITRVTALDGHVNNTSSQRKKEPKKVINVVYALYKRK